MSTKTQFEITRFQLLNDYQASWAFNWFMNNVPWQQDVYNFSGRKVNAPRLTALYGVDYHYSGLEKKALPLDRVLSRLLELVQSKADDDYVEGNFNSILLNYYRNGKDSIAAHSDDEPALRGSPAVASLSLGATRRMVFKAIRTDEQYDIKLEHGDYLLMHHGTQEDWTHAIPKKPTCSEPRISLTFRTITNP